MKVATITFHRAINFGAVFQTYALQYSIKDLGVESEVIDYRSDYLEKLHNPNNIKKYLNPKYFIWCLLKNQFYRDNRKNFYGFIKNNINTSSMCTTQEQLKNISNNYDKVIAGSDQIWNYNCTKFDKAFFLDFLDDNKKISYAASFGMKELPSNVKEEYRKLLSAFCCITVREKEGQTIVDDLLNKKVEMVLDPTLLINKSQWINLAKPYNQKKKYILVYLLGRTKSAFDYAKKLGKKNNFEVIYINENLLPINGMKNIYNIKPQEWLWLLNNAEYVVTNSFHGIAFSINFNKKFILDMPANSNKDYTRILTLLELLNVNLHTTEQENMSDFMEYKETEKSLETLQEKSKKILKEMIYG